MGSAAAADKNSRVLLTVDEVMEKLNCSRSTVYTLIRTGKLEHVVISKRAMRVTDRSVERMLDRLFSDDLDDEGNNT